MFINERYEKILTILNNEKSVSVKELSDRLGYSLATIRSDLNTLDNQGMLIRTHGGAVAAESSNQDKKLREDFEYRKQHNQQEKQLIAAKALKFIEPNMCIVFDASSSTYELAKLVNELQIRLTVITNGLRVAQLLKNNAYITTILIGGVIKGNSNAIEGLLGEELLNKINIDCAFISAQGFNLESGLTDFSLYEVELKKKMVSKAKKTFALLDYSKLEQSSIASFANYGAIDYLITDENVNKQIIEKYKKNNMEIIQAGQSRG